MEIKKVLIRKDGIKYCIIPKSSTIKEGSMVLITDNLNLINKFNKEEKNDRERN